MGGPPRQMRTEALQIARPGDPFVEWHLDPSRIEDVIVDGDHVAWTRLRRDGSERWATALGDDPDRIAALLLNLDSRAAVDGVTVPAGVHGRLPSSLRAPETGHWSLWVMNASEVPNRTQQRAAAASLIGVEDPRINELLRHSASAHVFAGDASVVRWAGVERGGHLVAVAGQEVEPTGAAHIVSVCTDPEFRGQGFGRAVCSRLVVAAVESGAKAVVLEMYAANDAGRALYRSVGFSEAGTYQSGLLRRPSDTRAP